MGSSAIVVDCVIFGGGAAGLFALERLRRAGIETVLMESGSLGSGQTRCAQGIIHGGTKYALGGWVAAASRTIAAMPDRWLRMAREEEHPSLAKATLRSRHCWLWRSDGLAGRLGMLGARLALRARPERVPIDERPAPLRAVTTEVLRLSEPIFDPCSVLEVLAAAHRSAIIAYRGESLEVSRMAEGLRLRMELAGSERSHPVALETRCAVLAAGVGNESLRDRFGLERGRTQRRPLHQALLRGASLPWLDGHCISGDRTRVTITSDRDREGRIVWHLGGELAESGVTRDEDAQRRMAVEEIRAVLPAVDLCSCEVATYRVDRAEPAEGGRRPDDARLIEDGPVISLWPTKLALAPRAADLALEAVRRWMPASVRHAAPSDAGALPGTMRARVEAGQAFENRGVSPAVAPPPWHDVLEWTPVP